MRVIPSATEPRLESKSRDPYLALVCADLFRMGHGSSRPLHRLIAHGWYAGLGVTALSMMLLSQDFAPAIILMAMLPLVLLCRGKDGVLLTASIAAFFACIGFMIASQQGLSPWLRSEAMTMMVLAPLLAFAVSVPAILELNWNKVSDAVLTQSSMSSMSDSTSRETVGKVTPVINRSRAA